MIDTFKISLSLLKLSKRKWSMKLLEGFMKKVPLAMLHQVSTLVFFPEAHHFRR